MTRIPAVTEQQAGPLGRLVFRAARRWYGSVPEPFAVEALERRAARSHPSSAIMLAASRSVPVVTVGTVRPVTPGCVDG